MKDRTIRRYLTGQLLIAMPQMPDPRFAKTVIYMCAHTAEGAMGLVVNRLFDGLETEELFEQLGIEGTVHTAEMRVHFGGPVESGRGFVLHSTDYAREATLAVDDDIALTATVEILKAIADGEGPRRFLLALGYAGWGPGQLDQELQNNGWLHAPASPEILFDRDVDTKWERAMARLGVSLPMLSADVGHA